MSGGGAHAAARAALLAVPLLLAAPWGAARAQDGLLHPGAKKPKPPPAAPRVEAQHVAGFPGLEAFRRSKYWAKAIDHLERGGFTDDALASMNQEFTVIKMSNEAGHQPAADAPAPRDATPRLGEKVGEDRRLWLWQVPIVLDRIAPLWKEGEWDDAQLAQAGVAGRFFAQQEGPPALRFTAGRHADNVAQLDRLMAWFRAEVARPESYALMLITDEDGPFVPAEGQAASKEKELGALVLDDARRLVLRRDEKGGGPWLIQLQKGKKAAWTRTLSRGAARGRAALRRRAAAAGRAGLARAPRLRPRPLPLSRRAGAAPVLLHLMVNGC
jgi:hypothetical protein